MRRKDSVGLLLKLLLLCVEAKRGRGPINNQQILEGAHNVVFKAEHQLMPALVRQNAEVAFVSKLRMRGRGGNDESKRRIMR